MGTGLSMGSEYLVLSGFDAVSMLFARLLKIVVATELGVSGCISVGVGVASFLLLENRLRRDVFGLGGGVTRMAWSRARSCLFCSAMLRCTSTSGRPAPLSGRGSFSSSFLPNTSRFDLLFDCCDRGEVCSSDPSVVHFSSTLDVGVWTRAAALLGTLPSL